MFDSFSVFGFSGIFGVGLAFFVVLYQILKGFALFRAARLGEKFWFWALLFVNIIALEIYYLYTRRKK